MRHMIWIIVFASLACGKVVKQRGLIDDARDFKGDDASVDFGSIDKSKNGGEGAPAPAPAPAPTPPAPGVREAPRTSDITAEVDRNAKIAVNIDLASVTTSPADDPPSYTLVTGAKHGTTSLDPNSGLLKYLPNHNFAGVDTLTYSATNTVGTSNISTITVNVLTILSKLKPTIAVRGMACLMCHANIKSNIVTDFGYPDAELFLGGPYTDFAGNGNSWYNNNQHSWQSAEAIHGQLFIPDAAAPTNINLQGKPLSAYPNLASKGMPTLLDLLNYTYNNENDFGNHYLKYDSAGKLFNPPHTNLPVSHFIKPPQAGLTPIVVNKTVTITAPSPSEILALAPELDANTVSFKAVTLAELPMAKPLSGLSVKTGAGSFVANDAGKPIVCYGDVVINGPLFLKTAQIETDAKGCRLYVTSNVFIEGPISYVNMGVSSHLQISSGRAIIMGIGSGPIPNSGSSLSALETRFNAACTGCNGLVNGRLRNGTTVTKDYWPSIQKDADAIVSVNGPLLDAMDPGSKAYDPATFADTSIKKPQAKVPYQRLLLNAPIVESRYLGNFSGTIISELALFPVGRFDFSYDATFDNPAIPFLPLLDEPQFFVQ